MLEVCRPCRIPDRSRVLAESLRTNVSVKVRASRGVSAYRMAAFMLGKTFTSGPLCSTVSWTRSTVVDNAPKVRAPFRSTVNPGPKIERKLSRA